MPGPDQGGLKIGLNLATKRDAWRPSTHQWELFGQCDADANGRFPFEASFRKDRGCHISQIKYQLGCATISARAQGPGELSYEDKREYQIREANTEDSCGILADPLAAFEEHRKCIYM